MGNLQHLKVKWGSSIVARGRISEFSGGILSEKYLANLDSLGMGPPRIRIGRKIAYPVAELVAWMEQRSQECERDAE